LVSSARRARSRSASTSGPIGTRLGIDETTWSTGRRRRDRGGAGPLNASAAIASGGSQARSARAFNTSRWENFAAPQIDGVQLDLICCGDDDARAAVPQVVRDVGLNPVWLGGVELVDAVARLWFALVFGQGRGRRLALQILEPRGAPA